MSAAQHARGSAALSRGIDRDIKASGVEARTERAAIRDERARHLARIADLDARLAREHERAVRLASTLLRSRAKARKERATWKKYALNFKRLLDIADRNRAWMGGLIRALLTPGQVQSYRDSIS